MIDLATAVVLLSTSLVNNQSMAGSLLVDEVEARSELRWETASEWPVAGHPVVWIGTENDIDEIPADLVPCLAEAEAPNRPEGFRLIICPDRSKPAVLVIGHDSRGAIYGTGYLLRKLRMSIGNVSVADALKLSSAPRYSLRGHQLGVRDTPNSYDAWDLDQWERYYRDLVVFGANAIELIPARTRDKRPSPLLPRPQQEMMTGMSALAEKYDLDVWVWYPAIIGNYADPIISDQHLKEAETTFKSLPRLDEVFVPGGDPGFTPTSVLMPFLKRKHALLQRFHPGAGMWVSPQGFGEAWMDTFIAYLKEVQPDWLTGVVYGPGVRLPLREFRARVPARYPIRSYPDITHTFHCQYPVPNWDRAFALTEGREPINPRPIDQAAIFRLEKDDVIGWLTYSEGCNDDVNKAVWSTLAWDPDTPIADVLRDYGRYFIGEPLADSFAQGLFALERNWRAPLASNHGVLTSLQQFQEMEREAPPSLMKNWRFQMALYRAYYDAFIYRRLLHETALEATILEHLARAPSIGSLDAIAAAEDLLARSEVPGPGDSWRNRVFELAEDLFGSIGMQLSVEKYQAAAVNRGANLDMIDFPLNNARWIRAQLKAIRLLPDEGVRLERLHELVNWKNPGPGGFYDDLGDVANEPHLVRRVGFTSDPGVLRSPADDFELIKDPPWYEENPYRNSWLSRASTLHGTPLRLRYDGLDPEASYRIRIVYPADRDDFVPKLRLVTDDGFEVHPLLTRPIPARPIEFFVPAGSTEDGVLGLELHREVTERGNGRGAQMAEVWLIRE
jgi:hypothetical protein